MPPTRLRIAAVGECMIELRHESATRLELGFGGDTFNVAVYLLRAAAADALAIEVDYATALGQDPYSRAMRGFFAEQGIGGALVREIPGRLPGLYAIHTDESGERRFFYWRERAAARAMFDGDDGAALAARLRGYDWIYFSGITLSILDDAARDRLFAALDAARARGARVVFDSNYRAQGWPDRERARDAVAAALRRADMALPTFEDEALLCGDPRPADTLARLLRAGVREVAVKNGGRPALASDGGTTVEIAPPPVARVVDTTAAGDAFSGAYLAARIAGRGPAEALARAHRMAAAVVQHRGAIIPRHAMPDLTS